MRPRTQTETVKALLCTGREAAESLTVTRESRSKFCCLFVYFINWLKKKKKGGAGDIKQLYKEKRK